MHGYSKITHSVVICVAYSTINKCLIKSLGDPPRSHLE